MSDLTVPTRPLTKSEANLKRPASSSRILRRGPSPGPLLGQDLPLSRSTSAFSRRDGGELVERGLQLLEPRRGGKQRGLHLGDGALGRARGLAAALQHLPVEAEAEADRDDGQEQVAGDVAGLGEGIDRREHLVEQPDDHGHQHGHREADDDLVDERQVAEVGLDQLEHADVGRHPRQDAEADHQEQPLGVAAAPRGLRSRPPTLASAGRPPRGAIAAPRRSLNASKSP